MRPTATSLLLPLGVCAALTVSGCSARTPEAQIGPGVLDTAVVAVSMSTTLSEGLLDTSSGTVLLIDEEGASTAIRTRGIHDSRVVHENGRLFFSDRHHDYIVGDGLVKHRRRTKESIHQDTIPTGGGSGYLAVFNVGYSDDGSRYESDVSSGDDRGQRERRVPVSFGVTARCESGAHATTIDVTADDSDRAERTLLRIDAGSGKLREVASWKPQRPVNGEHFARSPCVGDTVYFSVEEYEDKRDVDYFADYRHTLLVAWDVATGERVSVPLTGAGGDPVPSQQKMSPEATHVHDSRYYWINTDGEVHRADPETGFSEHLFTVPITDSQAYDNSAVFHRDRVYVLDHDWAKGRAALTEHRITDGQRLRQIPVPEVEALLRDTEQNVVNIAAVNP